MKHDCSIYKLATLILLLLASGFVKAAWVEVDPSENRAFIMFYDPESIDKVGDIATIKTLKNYKEAKNSVDPDKPYKFLSQTTVQEINCLRKKYRHREISMWSGLNATGKMEQKHMYSGEKGWGERVRFGSIESVVIDKACRPKEINKI